MNYKYGLLNRIPEARLRTWRANGYKLKEDIKIDPFLVPNIRELYKSIRGSLLMFHQETMNILIFGAGGVASWMLPQLLKVLYNYNTKRATPLTINITIIDGDTVNIGCV